MLVFAYFQPGTLVTRSSAIAILVLTAGYFVAGIGPVLPRWMTVIASNMALISAGPILYSGFSAFVEERKPVPDRLGWGVAILCVPAFWYWGLIEPNGVYRSVVFSLAVAFVSVRTAYRLFRAALQRPGSWVIRALAILFAVLTLWMIGRVILLLGSDLPPPDTRGANPTSWVTVFAYIVFMSLLSVCVMAMDVMRLNSDQASTVSPSRSGQSFVDFFRNKLLLLWSVVVILNFGIIGELGIAYTNFYQSEKARLISTSELANDAFVQHTIQIANQIDSMLRSVRAFYMESRSLAKTEAFIQQLGFDRSVIDNIYLIDSAGKIVISHDPKALGRSVIDREYFSFHQSHAEDQIYIAPVESGRVTGRFHFRVTRRLNRADGTFDGLVLATVDPESFARYYRELRISKQNIASLVGIADRKLRARVPEPPSERWQRPIESSLWAALEKSPAGVYENLSTIDNIRRFTVYKTVANLPLVMVTGFSESDVTQGVWERLRWLVATAIFFICFAFTLALLLTIEVKRRDEQERFMSMLSHELKTPMSVIRMSLGFEGLPRDIKDRVARSVADMNAIIERCLQSDRLLHGRVNLTAASCRIEEILEQVRASCTAPNRLVIKAERLPSFTTDAQLLSVILSNLFDNAIKYGKPESAVVVNATAFSDKGIPGIQVAVGNMPGSAGMPDPKRVFSKYYRAPGAHNKTGSGLGLHIAFGFARTIGGWLRYAPHADEVRFELWIPL